MPAAARATPSSTKNRALLAIAVVCAVGGLLLKLSDSRDAGPTSAAAPAGEAREPGARVGDDGAAASPEMPSPRVDGEQPSSYERGSGDAAAPREAPGAPAAHREGTFGWIGDTRRAAGTPTREPRVPRRAREGRAAPGVETAEVGTDAERMASAAGRGRMAAGSPAAGGAGGAGEVPAPPPAPTSVFTSGEGASYATEAQVEVPVDKLTAQAGTMSFWVQPDWQEGSKDDAAFLSVAGGRLQVFKNVNYLRFEFTDDAGNTSGLGVQIGQWKTGESHQVTTSWADNHFYLYVDGKPVSDTAWDPTRSFTLPPGSTLAIGSAYPEGRPVAPGTIGTVDVQGKRLSPAEIARRYDTVANAPKGKTATR